MKIIRTAKAAIRREKDSRRVAKSVADYQNTMKALGSASKSSSSSNGDKK